MKRNDFTILLFFFALIFLINAILLAKGSLKWGAEGFGIMVASGITIALYSFLYKDNPLFKMAEHFYVGVAAAYVLTIVWYDNIFRDVILGLKELSDKPFCGSVFLQILNLIIPSVLGLLLYTRLNHNIAWIGRIPFSFTVGFSAGIAIPLVITANILYQLKPTLVPLWTSSGPEWGAIVIFTGVVSTLIYFFFSIEHRGIIGWISRLGIWFLMLSFGASFGYTVMARISLLIGRVNFLFRDWIPLIK